MRLAYRLNRYIYDVNTGTENTHLQLPTNVLALRGALRSILRPATVAVLQGEEVLYWSILALVGYA